jgi:hypothetical protein
LVTTGSPPLSVKPVVSTSDEAAALAKDPLCPRVNCFFFYLPIPDVTTLGIAPVGR